MSRVILRPLAALAALVALGAYATIMLRGPQGLSALEEKRREIRVLEEDNADMQRDLNRQRDRIERLKNDPKTQEVEISKRLGRIHPGATQFKISGEPVHSPDDQTGGDGNPK